MAKMNEMVGRKVITTDAFTLGEVTEAEVDTSNWQITHLHISLTDESTKQLGFKKPFMGRVGVCLPINLVKAFGDVITLSKPMQEISNLPECKHH